MFQGRVLNVSIANVKKEEYKKMGPFHPLPSSSVRRAHTYKGEKYLNKRLEEVRNTSSWNSMYLNSTTVMDVITHKLGVKASDILDVETGNMAVRVALAETEVLEDTKRWLEQAGVRIEVLEVEMRVFSDVGRCAGREGDSEREGDSGEEPAVHGGREGVAGAVLTVRRGGASGDAGVPVGLDCW